MWKRGWSGSLRPNNFGSGRIRIGTLTKTIVKKLVLEFRPPTWPYNTIFSQNKTTFLKQIDREFISVSRNFNLSPLTKLHLYKSLNLSIIKSDKALKRVFLFFPKAFNCFFRYETQIWQGPFQPTWNKQGWRNKLFSSLLWFCR